MTSAAVQLTPGTSGVTPLSEVTFCVVDLETTGGSAAAGAMITEIGAVKVRGGYKVGEFQSLVDPGQAIPAWITELTGIDDALVAGAPGIESTLPGFLDFAEETVLVAHNAPFDLGFLRHFAALHDFAWPACDTVDTVMLARRTLGRDDSPNFKLGTLAGLFGSSTVPEHRALGDARATVDVLHGLLERAAGHGVTTLESLLTLLQPRSRRR